MTTSLRSGSPAPVAPSPALAGSLVEPRRVAHAHHHALGAEEPGNDLPHGSEEASGEWWLAVETLEDRAWCPACGVRALGHGRVVVRDLPLADRPVVLVWAKRLWRCTDRACPACAWSEHSDEIASTRRCWSPGSST